MRSARRFGLLAVLGLGAMVAIAWLMSRQDVTAARARLEGRSLSAHIAPYGQLEYAVEGTGAPLLMIHGSGGGFDQGLALSAGLARSHFRIIAPSRFGYLRSDYPAGASPELQADALAALLRRLGVSRTIIVGASAGALSATQLALRHPDLCRGLVLLVPAAYAPDRRRNQSAAEGPLARRLVGATIGSDLFYWLGIRLAPDVMTRVVLATEPELLAHAGIAERQRVRRVLEEVLPISQRRRGLALDSATASAPPDYPLQGLACPLLAISAHDDLYGTAAAARHAASQARSARLVLYESGGHLLVGRGPEVTAEIEAFAARLQR